MPDNHADDQASNLGLESNEPQSLTKDDIVQLVNQTLHNAMSKRQSAFEKKLTDLLDQKLSTISPSEPKEETSEDTKFNKSDYVSTKAELNKIKAEVEAMKQQTLEETKKLRETKLQSSLQEKLTQLNVAPSMIKAAIAVLKQDQLVGYDEQGNLLFNPSSEDVLDLETGLSNWIQSDDAKGFIQPRGTTGSGDKSYKQPTQEKQPGMTDNDLIQLITNGHLGS